MNTSAIIALSFLGLIALGNLILSNIREHREFVLRSNEINEAKCRRRE